MQSFILLLSQDTRINKLYPERLSIDVVHRCQLSEDRLKTKLKIFVSIYIFSDLHVEQFYLFVTALISGKSA